MASDSMRVKRYEAKSEIQWGKAAIYAILVVGAILSIVPFLYMLLTSIRSYGSTITNNFWPWWPLGDEPPQWNNFADAIQAIGMDRQWGVSLFVRYLMNSVIVAGAIVGGTLLTSILAAYAFAYIRIPGNKVSPSIQQIVFIKAG